MNQFPEKSLGDSVINDRINRIGAESVAYSESTILGYPASQPLEISLKVLSRLSLLNPNNIGTHTTDEAEHGFSGTQALEREAVYMVGSLFNADEFTVDGYITSGGTEGNIMGLWMLRDYFINEYNSEPEFICSNLAHYSIDKALSIMNCMQRAALGYDENYSIDVDLVEERIRHSAAEGQKNFVIVGVLGHTVTGSIDDILALNDLANRLGTELGVQVRIHIDAAHGGFIYPFVADNQYGFNLNNVATVSIDAHKLGLVSYSCGVFLCKKGGQSHIRTSADYIKKGYCDTLLGSRSGAIAGALWSAIVSQGRTGYKDIYTKCLDNRDYFIRALKCSEYYSWHYTNPFVNIVALDLGENGISKKLEKKYALNQATLGSRRVYKIIFMPHVGKKLIDEFFEDVLKERLDSEGL